MKKNLKRVYNYNSIPDKSKEGMEKELREGLITIGVYMFQTMGFPIECFKDQLELMNNKAEQWLFYLNFRNKHPNAFRQSLNPQLDKQ